MKKCSIFIRSPPQVKKQQKTKKKTKQNKKKPVTFILIICAQS